MNEKKIIRDVSAAGHEEAQLRSALMDGYDSWEYRRRETLLGIRNAAVAACIVAVLAVPRVVKAQQLPPARMNVTHGAGYAKMFYISTQIVNSL